VAFTRLAARSTVGARLALDAYRSIDPEQIVVTAERLARRIGERFPASGLASVSRAVLDVVLIGAAMFFLATVEVRVKRRRALRAIHELRAMAQVIDRHPPAKDPSVARTNRSATASSPARVLSRYELVR